MVTVNKYNIGDLVRATGIFTDSDGTQVDPTTVTVYVKDPSSNVSELVYGVDTDVIKSDTGAYYYDITIDEAGNWYYRWKGVGAAVAADQERFYVEPLLIST